MACPRSPASSTQGGGRGDVEASEEHGQAAGTTRTTEGRDVSVVEAWRSLRPQVKAHVENRLTRQQRIVELYQLEGLSAQELDVLMDLEVHRP